MAIETRQQLIQQGMSMLLKHGYHDLGVAAVLEAAEVARGSFYHYFDSKEAFALAVIDEYMKGVHAGLDQTLGDLAIPPLQRIRNFFGAVADSYKGEGYLGCLLGGLGQELSGVSETFRRKVEHCIGQIAQRLAGCLKEAQSLGQLRPGADPDALSELLVNCWEGAALRSRLRRDPAPLKAMLDFYFSSAST
jgi:TetR/AcrR family transcriptional repressor of nem operon